MTSSESEKELSSQEASGIPQDIEEERSVLIMAVKNKPILYNIASSSNRNKHLRESAWNEVGQILKRPDSWCKTEWGKLREAYKKRKKTLIGKTGQARKKIENWCHFLELQFLDDYEIVSKTTGNIGQDDPDVLDADKADNEQTSEPAVVHTPNEPSPSSSNVELRKKDLTYSLKRHKKRCPDQIDQELVNFLKKPKTPEDEYHHFGMAIAQQMRDLKPEVAGLAKIRITQIMYELQFPQNSSSLVDESDVSTESSE